MMKKQDNIIQQIKEKVNEVPKKEIIEWLNTGCTILNLIQGGGNPKGRIINIVGDKSSGKTILALEFCAMQKNKNKNCKIIYDDAEGGFNFDEKNLYGVQIYNANYNHSNTVEDLEYNIEKEINNLKKNEQLIYVLDSLDAIGSEAELKRRKKKYKAKEENKNLEKGSYNMTKQKELSSMFRDLSKKIRESNSILIIISQVRYNIGVMFGEKYSVSGGKALEFYASIRLYLAECEKNIKKDRAIGITIKAKTKKNKVGLPFREGFIDILFDYGIDNIMSNINYLYDLRDKRGRLKSKTIKLNWDGEDFSIRSLIKYIEANNLEKELENKVIEKWNKIEKDIANTDRKKKY